MRATLIKSLLVVTLAFVALAAIIGGTVFWMTDPMYLRAPKDHELISVFQERRAAFESLRNMTNADELNYVSESHIDDHIASSRKQQYRDLLSDIRSGLVVTSDPPNARFIFAIGGLSAIGSGWLKGIAYIPENAEREGVIMGSLDQPESLASGEVYLRQIEAHWYLIFQKVD